MIRTERTFGGGTHRVVTITDRDAMSESARFLALERESNRLMDECDRLTDESLAANQAGDLERARTLFSRGNECLREASKLRRQMSQD